MPTTVFALLDKPAVAPGAARFESIDWYYHVSYGERQS
jgi:hypothetical protein